MRRCLGRRGCDVRPVSEEFRSRLGDGSIGEFKASTSTGKHTPQIQKTVADLSVVARHLHWKIRLATRPHGRRIHPLPSPEPRAPRRSGDHALSRSETRREKGGKARPTTTCAARTGPVKEAGTGRRCRR